LTILEAGIACAWIGPTPSNTAVLFVQRVAADAAHEGAFKNSIVDALTAAQTQHGEVAAGHADNESMITSLSVGI
jgi:hypothetical protein